MMRLKKILYVKLGEKGTNCIRVVTQAKVETTNYRPYEEVEWVDKEMNNKKQIRGLMRQ